MSAWLLFALIGLGTGAIYSAFGIGLVTTYRASGVINFAYGAIAMISTYVYANLRISGDLIFPIKGIPAIHLSWATGIYSAAAVAVVFAILLSLLLHYCVYQPLRHAPPLAKAVASVGVMLTLEALAVLRYGSNAILVQPVIPNGPIHLFGQIFPRDRLWLSAAVVIVALALGGLRRFTRFGLATEACAENEVGASALGYSPQFIASSNAVISAIIASGFGILVAPIVSLAPESYTLLIVPALGVALLAKFRSYTLCVVGGLGLGICQSLAVKAAATWSWFPQTGVGDALPLVVIIVVMVLDGKSLPTRGEVLDVRLPAAPVPRFVLRYAVLWVALAVFGVLFLGNSWRLAIITTMTTGVLCLSIVVLTGFLGQVSLAQLAFAGVAGFSLSKFSSSMGIPFPFSPVLAILVSAVLGVLVGLPALRVRGASLALVTLTGGVAITDLLFKNPAFTGGYTGSPIPDPKIFGIDLAVARPGNYPTLIFAFGVLAVLVLSCLFVVNLRRSSFGRQMLAVRANERAAAALGISVSLTKLTGFVISSVIAGIGGVLVAYGQPSGNLSADAYGVLASVGLLATCYLGGVGMASGAVIGGVLAVGGLMFFGLSQVFDGFNQYQGLIGGLGLIITAVLNPDGVAGGLSLKVRQRLARAPIATGLSGPTAPVQLPAAVATKAGY